MLSGRGKDELLIAYSASDDCLSNIVPAHERPRRRDGATGDGRGGWSADDERWYGINPMAGVIEGFRWALLGAETAPGPIVIVSAVVAVGLLVSGAFYSQRMKKMFADVV
jgi:hypothetical protein